MLSVQARTWTSVIPRVPITLARSRLVRLPLSSVTVYCKLPNIVRLIVSV
jgi:hypothetical protein